MILAACLLFAKCSKRKGTHQLKEWHIHLWASGALLKIMWDLRVKEGGFRIDQFEQKWKLFKRV